MGDEVTIKIQEDGKEVDKVLKVEDVKNLFDQHSELTGKMGKLSGFSKALEKYGTDQDTYLSNAEAAFGVISELTEKGLIDGQGNIVEGKSRDDSSKKKDGDLDFDFDFSDSKKDKDAKIAHLVAQVVETKLGSLVKQVENLSSGQAGLYRAQLKSAVQAKHSSLSDNDVSKLFGIASANPTKDLWAHAEEMVKGKEKDSKTEREKYAKEFGVDLKDFDANKLNEQSGGGGSIPALEGKKLIFGPRAKRLGTKDSVSPREAMILHMKKVESAQR